MANNKERSSQGRAGEGKEILLRVSFIVDPKEVAKKAEEDEATWAEIRNAVLKRLPSDLRQTLISEGGIDRELRRMVRQNEVEIEEIEVGEKRITQMAVKDLLRSFLEREIGEGKEFLFTPITFLKFCQMEYADYSGKGARWTCQRRPPCAHGGMSGKLDLNGTGTHGQPNSRDAESGGPQTKVRAFSLSVVGRNDRTLAEIYSGILWAEVQKLRATTELSTDN